MKEFIDKLNEKLEEAKVSANRRNAFDSEVSYACAIDIVNKLAEEYKVSEMPTGWIPCSERLPKQNEEVLATILLKGKPMVLIINYDHTWLDDGLSKLIAWMPLPAPFKEGD